MVQFLLVLAILVLVVLFVSGPFRRRGGARAEGPPASASQLDELEAARESKYREIRDAELDHRTGKLSDEDFEAIDTGLRAEAVEILRALDRVRGTGERLPS
jgi:hypothetical protein